MAVRVDTDVISKNQVGKISNIDGRISQSNWFQQLHSDGNRLEVDAVGLVVLSGLKNVSDNNSSIGNSSGLSVGVLRSQNVSSNGVVSSDGSSRSNDIVDNSLNDTREGLSLEGNGSGSSNINDPSGAELAAFSSVPVNLVEGSGVNSQMINIIGCTVASNQESITILERSNSVGAKLRQFGLNGGVIGLSGIECCLDCSLGSSCKSGLKVVGSSENTSNVSRGRLCVSIGSVRVKRSRGPGSISSNKEREGGVSINKVT